MDRGTTWLLRGVLTLVLLYFVYAGYERTVGWVLNAQFQTQQSQQALAKCQADLKSAKDPESKEKK